MLKAFLSVSLLVLASICNAQPFIFIGIPSAKIIEGGNERTHEKIEFSNSNHTFCIIKEVNGEFYWESRDNKQLFKIESGAFITFIDPEGSGYVRLINPSMKSAASLMSDTEKSYDYTEHILLGLRTITYYGKSN